MLGLPAILLCGRRDGRALARLRAHGIEPHCIYPERDADNPPRGCYEAHTLALATALRNRWLPCVVLEDNLEVAPEFDANLLTSALTWALAQRPSIVHLSRRPLKSLVGQTEHPNVVRLHGTLDDGVAYVATERTLAMWPEWRNQHFDQHIAQWSDRLAIYPMPFHRASVPSINRYHIGKDLSGRVVPSWLVNALMRTAPLYCRIGQHLDNWMFLFMLAMAVVAIAALRLR